jgi:hypothetical protein
MVHFGAFAFSIIKHRFCHRESFYTSFDKKFTSYQMRFLSEQYLGGLFMSEVLAFKKALLLRGSQKCKCA